MKSSNILSLRNDDVKTLLMKGKHTASEVINSAIEAGEIDESDRQFWEEYDNVDVCYFKAVPKPGYSAYYHESSKGVKGAFLATAITVYW
ncbi:hypothetical protein [Proteus sp. G2671]|uniref:hypothetical protein n=1 Tax=Proteus sp. G2671 TaxID=2698883 RepID=UPI00137791F0|nr:hypothetical protein [Proteus sp. G2671]NBM04512.1 hypothetical protein [Proteus sp. G2671]